MQCHCVTHYLIVRMRELCKGLYSSSYEDSINTKVCACSFILGPKTNKATNCTWRSNFSEGSRTPLLSENNSSEMLSWLFCWHVLKKVLLCRSLDYTCVQTLSSKVAGKLLAESADTDINPRQAQIPALSILNTYKKENYNNGKQKTLWEVMY